jgi:hypothetical protein
MKKSNSAPTELRFYKNQRDLEKITDEPYNSMS